MAKTAGVAHMKKKKKEFSFQLLRSFLLSSMIPFVVCTLLTSYVYSASYSRDMQRLVDTTMVSLARGISTYLEELKQVTLMPYYNDDIYLYMKALQNGTEMDIAKKLSVQKMMESSFTFVRHSRDDTNGIFIMNSDECIYYTVNNFDHISLIHPYDYESEEWYQKAFEAGGRAILWGPHIPNYIIPTGKQPMLSVVRSIVELETRESLGVIKIDVNTALFQKNFGDFNFHVASKILVCDQQKKVLYTNSELSSDEKESISHAVHNTISLNDGNWKIFSYKIENTPWEIRVLLSDAELSHGIITIYLTALILYLFSVAVAMQFYRRSSEKIIAAVENMKTLFLKIQKGDLSQRYRFVSDTELDTLGECLNIMTERLDDQIKKEYIMTIEQKKSEFAALQAQINPHFLFNTLNNFIALNQMGEKQKLEDSLYMLADLMRYTLKAPSYVQLSDEIKFLRAYCSLQKLRFEDRLRYEIHINTEISRIKIPKLLLQPIVENSVIHGCEPAQKICTINITVSRKEEKLVIIIEDDGVGFEIKDSNIYESIGLSNIKKRLAIFSSDSRIEMTSTPGVGTRTVIYIKINEDMTL